MSKQQKPSAAAAEASPFTPTRVRIVQVDAGLWWQVFRTRGPETLSCDGIPPDAKLLRVWIDEERAMVCGMFEHPSFAPIQHPHPPIQEIRFKRHE